MPNYKIERDPDTLRNSRHGGTPPDEKDRTQHQKFKSPIGITEILAGTDHSHQDMNTESDNN